MKANLPKKHTLLNKKLFRFINNGCLAKIGCFFTPNRFFLSSACGTDPPAQGCKQLLTGRNKTSVEMNLYNYIKVCQSYPVRFGVEVPKTHEPTKTYMFRGF